MWSTVTVNNKNYSHLHQTENFSCAPSCVAMLVWNMGVGVGFDGWAKSTAKWSKYDNGLKNELNHYGWANNLMNVGMNVQSISTLLKKYGLNYSLYEFDVNGVPQQHVNEEALRLQNMADGDMVMLCNSNHVVLAIKDGNGFAYLDPFYGTANANYQSDFADPMQGDGPTIVNANNNLNESALLFQIDPNITFGPIIAAFHVPKQNLLKTQIKTIGQSICSLHQYLTYYLT